MIGDHSVTFMPDPNVASWGPILNSNSGFTTDLAGWIRYAGNLTGAWTWGAGGYAIGTTVPTEGAWLVRDETAPIPRGASTLFRVRFRFSVAKACRPTFGLFYGDTAHNATQGPFWAGTDHCRMAEAVIQCATAGTYVAELIHDPSNIPPQFAFIAPEMHWGQGDNPVLDSIELWGQGSDLVDLSCLTDTVTIHHGRDDTNSQPEASSCTVELSLDTGEDELPAAVDIGGIIRVVTRLGSGDSTRFVGRVTDITQSWQEAGEQTPNRVEAQIVATSALAELGRHVVGDAPWGQELDGSRVSRIMAAAGITLDPVTSDPGTVQILPRDVDSQPALDVAQVTAESASGIVWATRSGDIRYADADHRKGGTAELELDACDILVAPRWSRTTDGLINEVSIGYGPTPEGSDQPRYVASSPSSVARFGSFGYSATTELATSDDATALGRLLLARNSLPVWVMPLLPVDVGGLGDTDTDTLLALEMHDLISLTGLPSAGNAPTSAYLWVEGWTERLVYGGHELELVVSGYCRTAPAPEWDDVNPATTWDGIDPTLTWDDAACLGPSPNLGRWADVPAGDRWNTVPSSVTWDSWK